MPIQTCPAPDGGWGSLRGQAGPGEPVTPSQAIPLCAEREQLPLRILHVLSLHWVTLASVCWIGFVYMFSPNIPSSMMPSLTEPQFSKFGDTSELKVGPVSTQKSISLCSQSQGHFFCRPGALGL